MIIKSITYFYICLHVWLGSMFCVKHTRYIILSLSLFLFVAVAMGGAAPVAEAKQNSSSTVSSKKIQPKSLDWYREGKTLVRKNKKMTIYDIRAGITWNALYINGSNHADIIPASAADAKKIAGKKIGISSARRPVIVTIAGTKYAGSMYAVAHGKTNYCNYFNGVMCLHFTGSKTHGTQKVDAAHQAAITTASRAGIQ